MPVDIIIGVAVFALVCRHFWLLGHCDRLVEQLDAARAALMAERRRVKKAENLAADLRARLVCQLTGEGG